MIEKFFLVRHFCLYVFVKFHKLKSNIFSCQLKKNFKWKWCNDNENNLSQKIFYLFCCFFQRKHTCVITWRTYLRMSIVRTIYDNAISKEQKCVRFKENILSSNKQNIDFNTLFYQCLVTSSRVSNSIVKYRYSLLFIDSNVSLFIEK